MNIVRIVKIPLVFMRDVVGLLIMYLPGSTGILLRRLYYGRVFKRCGKNLTIDIGVSISGAEFISVGDNVYIDKYCVIATGKTLAGKIERKHNKDFEFVDGEIVIGNDVHIVQFCIIMGYGGVHIENNCVLSANSKIYSLTNTAHDLKNKSRIVSLMPYAQANFLLSPVVLKFNVWLGLNVIAMPGVTVNRNSFSVSNSLLLGSFPENSYIAGQPAKRIRERFPANNDVEDA
jgi:acetyltransferase-like isoleucine patch superfamily enzyme